MDAIRTDTVEIPRSERPRCVCTAEARMDEGCTCGADDLQSQPYDAATMEGPSDDDEWPDEAEDDDADLDADLLPPTAAELAWEAALERKREWADLHGEP